jgi:hypothetical protein
VATAEGRSPVPAAYYKIHVEQGATWRRVLTLKDDDGDPVDLTGFTARMQVRESQDSPTPLLSLTTGSGITVDGPAGQLTLLIADETSTAWTWRYGVYDLEVESAGGEVTRLLRGEIEVDREVTR